MKKGRSHLVFTAFQEGRDVVACLNEAMGRQGLNMRVSALVHRHS